MVSIHKFRVYKTMSRPGVDESSERDFIKVILTKDQERSKGNEKRMRIRKSGCVELNWTRCCTGEFNVTLSLCGVLGDYSERKPFGLLKCEVKWNADGTATEGLADRTAQKRQQTWESDNTVRRGSHQGGSPQNVLGDEQTCGTTLASAYVLHCLSAAWSQLQMKEGSLSGSEC